MGLHQRPKRLSPRFFYDAAGSALFRQITELDAYYVGRTERAILKQRGRDIVAWIKPESVLFEPGAGDCVKVELLLAHAHALRGYLAQDISGAALRQGTARLRQRFPNLQLRNLTGDFSRLAPREVRGDYTGPVCVFFPGSTLGNFEPHDAVALLRRFRAIAGDAGQLLLGVDLVKDRAVLELAYNDPEGVTAAFNLNLLQRLVREAGAHIELDAFVHEAVFNAQHGRIEMWLRARRATTIELSDEHIAFAPGEGICTEYSYKYRESQLQQMGEQAGFRLERVFTDERSWFAVAAFAAH